MDNEYYTTIGMDVSDRKAQVCVMAKAGATPKIVMETTIPTTKDGLAKFLSTQDRSAPVAFETGQETAADLAKFLPTVPGAGVNFDPANMILYGKGSPVEAVRTLAPWIKHVHLKDAVVTKKPGTWGTEVPWGDGEVDAPRFLAELEAAGYKGNFAIEREGGNDRPGDIALAAKRLLGQG